MKKLLLCAVLTLSCSNAAWAALPVFRIVRNLNDTGTDSLRQHILNAQAGDKIVFDSALNGGTITLTSGEIVIRTNLSIIGPGADLLAVRGGASFPYTNSRGFTVSVGVSATISGLTLTNGRIFGTNGTSLSSNDEGLGTRGQDAEGGGILNRGTLTLTDLIVRDCRVVAGNGGYDRDHTYVGGTANGGAIANYGGLNLSNCVLRGNFARGGNGGVTALPPSNACYHGSPGSPGRGGAIANRGFLRVSNSTFETNSVVGGTGADSYRSNSVLTCYAGSGGSAAGGAIWNDFAKDCHALGSTFVSNSVTGGDAGIAHPGTSSSPCGDSEGGAIYSDYFLAITSCTLMANVVRAGTGQPSSRIRGGGIFSRGRLNVTSCTISGNAADSGDAGGIFKDTDDTPIVWNSILALNAGSDVFGNFTSLGFNFIGVTDGSSGWLSSDQTGTSSAPIDPLLTPLADHGGWTSTLALAPGSPARDAGDNSLLNILATDQRGGPRKVGASVDIGAYETGTCPVVNTNNSGPGSLRQAIAVASSTETIVFTPGLAGTIGLISGQITITAGRRIVGGPGAITVGGSGDRVFNIASNTSVFIANLAIAHGRVASGLALGGGVLNYGTLTLSNCTLWNNQVIGTFAGLGGGAANLGTLQLVNCTIASNSASGSGGVAIGAGGGVANQGALILRSSTVSANSAGGPNGGYGGGVYQTNGLGSTTVRNTLVADNSVSGTGSRGSDVNGAFVSLGFNLISTSFGGNGFNAVSDKLNVPALLGPLQDNGGPTLTMALLNNSPAIDQGNSGEIIRDQRGFVRPINFITIANAPGGDGADIGSFELQAPSVDIGLRIYDGRRTVRIAVEPPGALNSPFRIRKNGTDYGIVLVATNAPEASRLRMQTPSGIKAWATLP